MKKIVQYFVFVLVVSSISLNASASTINTPSDVEVVYNWTEYATIDGIKIEYKYEHCDNENVKNQVLVLFRYTNTTSESKSISWISKIYRDGLCNNCHRLENPEYYKSINLEAGEVLEGTGESKMDKRVYLFSHFVNLVPGMTNSKLTNFEFMDINVITINN